MERGIALWHVSRLADLCRGVNYCQAHGRGSEVWCMYKEMKDMMPDVYGALDVLEVPRSRRLVGVLDHVFSEDPSAADFGSVSRLLTMVCAFYAQNLHKVDFAGMWACDE